MLHRHMNQINFHSSTLELFPLNLMLTTKIKLISMHTVKTSIVCVCVCVFLKWKRAVNSNFLFVTLFSRVEAYRLEIKVGTFPSDKPSNIYSM